MRIRFAALLALPLSAAAGAAGFADIKALDARVAAFTGLPMGEEGGAIAPVDPRLKLADCGAAVALDWRTVRQDAVTVSCPGAWKIYVPVRQAAAARQASAAGAPAAARAEPVVRRGDPVTVAAGSGGFSVTSEGVAMTDAPPGGRLRVQVAGSRLPIQAVAVEPGLVTLPGS